MLNDMGFAVKRDYNVCFMNGLHRGLSQNDTNNK